MKKLLPLSLFLLSAYTVPAQKSQPRAKPEPVNEYAAIDKKTMEIPAAQTNTTQDVARYINAGFSTEKDKVRAIFIWTASSFEYDVANMYALNFNEKREEKIERIMKLRRGICESYAAVFNDLCTKCGLKSYVVTGYTRYQGQTSDLAHAWVTVWVDNKYYLFDPTWGSGYVTDRQFVRKINNFYFMQQPEVLIKSHMPFDPMWQMMHYPITAAEFAESKTAVDTTKPYFSYTDSIAAYEKLDQLQQFEAEARRMEQNGVKTSMAFNYFSNLKRNIEIERQNDLINTYNGAIGDYNAGIKSLNDFINYRNAQFSPTRPDAEIQGMVDSIDKKMTRVQTRLTGIKGRDSKVDELITPLQKSIDDVSKTVGEQQDFLKKYFPKSKMGRRGMFYKYTWMGIPLN